MSRFMRNTSDIQLMLLEKYKHSPVILLETVLRDFFPHLNLSSAKKKAACQMLPFPVFKAEKSQKSPYLVNILDLAKYLARQSDLGTKDWESMNR